MGIVGLKNYRELLCFDLEYYFADLLTWLPVVFAALQLFCWFPYMVYWEGGVILKCPSHAFRNVNFVNWIGNTTSPTHFFNISSPLIELKYSDVHLKCLKDIRT